MLHEIFVEKLHDSVAEFHFNLLFVLALRGLELILQGIIPNIL